MKKKILVVENERTTATVAKQQLERADFDVYMVSDGKQALDLIKQFNVDLVITDVEMPVMDGVDLFKMLKSDKRLAKIPIIVMTSNEIFKRAFTSLGVDGFVAKPLTGKGLLKKVEEILGELSTLENRAKVLLLGNNSDVIKQMEELLRECRCGVFVAKNGAELMSHALGNKPDIIIIDILVTDVPSHEIIKALRSFNKLRDAHIIIYSYLTPEELGCSQTINLKDFNERCENIGVSKNIGRFTQTTFLDSLREFGI